MKGPWNGGYTPIVDVLFAMIPPKVPVPMDMPVAE